MDRAAELKRRIEDFSRDPFLKIIYFCSPIFIVQALFPNKSEPWWAKHIMSALLVSLLWAILRHRFYISAFGSLICLGGAGLSLWYDLSGTKRPAWDQYTGLLLLTGLAIVGLDILIGWMRYRAWEREAAGTSSEAAL